MYAERETGKERGGMDELDSLDELERRRKKNK
jgi:hypothetical protein